CGPVRRCAFVAFGMPRSTVPRAVLLCAVLVFGCGKRVGDSIEATGTLEVIEVGVSATVSGRVDRVLVIEGQSVHAGDTLAILTQPTLSAEQRQRAATARAARAALDELQHGSRPEELRRAQADLSAAEAD